MVFFRDGNMRGFTDMKNKLGFVIISFRQPGVESETFLGYD